MNTIITSKDAILKSSREIIKTEGFSALSIRSVAAKAGISVGSVYNYFPSKSALICAAVENIWMDIFHHDGRRKPFADIEQCIVWIFACLDYGSKEYPGFMEEHSFILSADHEADRIQMMEKAWNHILFQISSVLKRDHRIRNDAFNAVYTPERFAGMLFSLILSSALHHEFDPYMVLETVHRALY